MDMPAQKYCIRIRSHLDEGWADWFEGMTIQHTASDETVLTGVLQDQSALYGTLMKIRDLGLTLIAVECIDE
jgi:hypothetical protein